METESIDRKYLNFYTFIIQTLEEHIKSKKKRKEIHGDLITAFRYGISKDIDPCLGYDDAFDRAYEEEVGEILR